MVDELSEALQNELRSRLDQLLMKARDDLRKQLYPIELGQRSQMSDEIKLVTISAFEGYARALKDLGIDTSQFEQMIADELDKILK